jgi:hypothetical protein
MNNYHLHNASYIVASRVLGIEVSPPIAGRERFMRRCACDVVDLPEIYKDPNLMEKAALLMLTAGAALTLFRVDPSNARDDIEATELIFAATVRKWGPIKVPSVLRTARARVIELRTEAAQLAAERRDEIEAMAAQLQAKAA